MISIQAKKRADKKAETGNIPAILYGPNIENVMLQVNGKEFEKAYAEAQESLISLDAEGKNYSVLIYYVQQDPVSSEYIHIDFYQPNLKEEVETDIPLEITGEAPAVKNLGGTLITNINDITVKALPKDIPAKITIDVSRLNTFEDFILIKDVIVPQGVKVLNDPEEIVVQVTEPENVEAELAKPIETTIAEPVKAEEGKKKEEEPEPAEKKE
ncbi:MAG: 50S ribosomal protein L25 [Candidatus Pacebacteria bacterium]|nr:50S ribosomal protein L25 [Candidatus Paceibacterota bacterium]